MTAQVAVITGASSGIGAATASRFAGAGWRVVNIARRPSRAAGVVNVSLDLSEPEALSRIGAELEAPLAACAPAGDRLRICLVHNAAAFERDTALTMDAEHLRRVLEINLVAPAVLNAALQPRMAPGSSIIYIGSTLSEKAVSGRASYVISKHGVVGLMRATCQDAQDGSLHTVCICPGFVDTQMLGGAIPSDEVRRRIEARTAFGRLISPEEIAALVWMAAATPALNGAVVHANLGQLEQ